MSKALVKLTGPNRKVWFLSEDGETINAIKNNQEVYKFSGSGSDTPTAEPVYTYKGSKATYEELPTVDNAVGDVWNVVAAHEGYAAGMNYAWNGTDWDAIGGLYTDTWRPIQVDGSDAITDSSTALNLVSGTNVSLSYSEGTITVSVPDSAEITNSSTDVSLTLSQNTIYYCTNSALATLNIAGEATGFKYAVIIFNSPSDTATQFSMPDDNGYHYCVGDDCDGDGAFTPVANMRYNLAIQSEYDRIAIYVMKAL